MTRKRGGRARQQGRQLHVSTFSRVRVQTHFSTTSGRQLQQSFQRPSERSISFSKREVWRTPVEEESRVLANPPSSSPTSPSLHSVTLALPPYLLAPSSHSSQTHTHSLSFHSPTKPRLVSFRKTIEHKLVSIPSTPKRRARQRLVTGSSRLLDDVGELLELSLGSEEGTELWEVVGREEGWVEVR